MLLTEQMRLVGN